MQRRPLFVFLGKIGEINFDFPLLPRRFHVFFNLLEYRQDLLDVFPHRLLRGRQQLCRLPYSEIDPLRHGLPLELFLRIFAVYQKPQLRYPVVAPAAVQILDWLIAYGVREIISCGSCGVLVGMEENVFLVPCKALRDEGTSYHYLPPARFVEISEKARAAIEKAINNYNLHYLEVVAWSTDGFFRETKEKVDYRKREGFAGGIFIILVVAASFIKKPPHLRF